MSQHIEVPLRPPTQPWPGLGTRVGFLDPGMGFLEDGSVNVMINRGDTLEKRKGFIRGLDEFFNGVVCGLFKYTSNCGVESLIVADESGISIRTPYAIPIFENSDAYPFDNFNIAGFPNSYYWRNTERYVQAEDELGMRQGAALSTTPQATSDIMRWFKQATNLSYQVRIEYEFDTAVASEQVVSVVIKGNGDLSSGSYLLAQIRFGSGTYAVALYHFDGTSLDELGSFGLTGSTTQPEGFLTLSYTRDVATGSYRARATALPFGGQQQILNGDLNAVQDSGLGQVSGIGIGHVAAPQPNPKIRVVDGGPI